MSTPVILGPTCCGKSAKAIEMAQEIGAEIISCDSMQVYRGLEIGTAQPTIQEQCGIPHHLIGNMDISEPYDVNRFLEMAKAKLAELKAKGKPAIIVGGTGLYAKSLVYGHNLLPADTAIAKQIAQSPHCELEAELISAAGNKDKIPKDVLLNPRRLARAVEVLRITGRLAWEMQSAYATPSPDFRQIIIMPELEPLRKRIKLRTEKMIADGWIEEAQLAIGKGLMTTPTARQALGYREIDDFLEGRGPAHSIQDLIELIAMKTGQFARRQLTWFRHQHPGAEMVNM